MRKYTQQFRGGSNAVKTSRFGHAEVSGLRREGAKLAHFCSMCGPHFCSMKITQDVREYAAQKQVDTEAALSLGMKEKAQEFVDTGGEIYRK